MNREQIIGMIVGAAIGTLLGVLVGGYIGLNLLPLTKGFETFMIARVSVLLAGALLGGVMGACIMTFIGIRSGASRVIQLAVFAIDTLGYPATILMLLFSVTLFVVFLFS